MTKSFAAACADLDSEQYIVRRMGKSYTCEEHGITVNVVNTTHRKVLYIKMDGGLFQGNACDWGICDGEYTVGALIELKGRDVEHAIQQLRITCSRLRREFTGAPQIKSAYIVSRQNHIGPGWQNLAKQFHKETKARLERYGVNRQPLPTERLFSARGRT